MKAKVNGKDVGEVNDLELEGYFPTKFEGDKIIIFVKGMICTKANLFFRKPTEEELKQ